MSEEIKRIGVLTSGGGRSWNECRNQGSSPLLRIL